MGKFKNWLIKKLGGTVTPLPRVVKIEHIAVTPITVNAIAYGNYRFGGSDRMKKEACKELGNYFYENQELLKFNVCYDRDICDDKLTVSLRVLPFMEEENESNM